MIRYLIFLVLTLPILLKFYKNSSVKEKVFMIINYFFVFWLFQYFLSAFLDDFRPILKSGFSSFALNEIEYIKIGSYKIFIICYLLLSIIMTGISIGMLVLKNKYRKQFLYSLPFVWIFSSIKIAIGFIEEYNDIYGPHWKVFLFSLIVIGVILGLVFILYNLKLHFLVMFELVISKKS